MTYAELIYNIRKSIKGEYEEYKYYLELAKKAPNIKANEILSDIAKDKKEHAYVLRKAYFKLTGRMHKEELNVNIITLDYNKSLEERILIETKDGENYKKLYLAAKMDWLQDIFFKIMHDANKYNAKLLLLIKGDN